MTTRTGGAVQASVSVEDISRQYYESAGYSMWITAMHVDPLELIANDDSSGKAYRIPVELSGDKFTFGEAQEVAITYVDVKSAAAAKIPHRWGSKAAALAAAGLTETRNGDVVLTDTTPPEADLPIAPEVTPAGAAIRKMATATKTPDADTATGQPDEQREASVDAAKMREALGLSADATDAEVQTAVAAALSVTPQQPTGGSNDPASLLSSIPEGSGAIVLDRENYKALLATAAKGEKAFEAMQRNERDSYLTKACEEGRFPVARLEAYQKMWDTNPAGTKDFVALMPKNSVPTMSVGFLGSEVNANESDLAYEGMYGKAGA